MDSKAFKPAKREQTTSDHMDIIPVDRNHYSDWALGIIEKRGLTSGDDPVVTMITLLDELRIKLEKDASIDELKAVASRFEGNLALAQVEFGRIDLALDSIQKFTERLDNIEKRFTQTTDKVLKQSVAAIAINYVMPLVYVLFGVVLCFALQKLLGHL
jgi:hypothetical protein